MDKELCKEFFSTTEQSWFEENFVEDAEENFRRAWDKYTDAYLEGSAICERVASGEILDPVHIRLCIERMIITHKFVQKSSDMLQAGVCIDLQQLEEELQGMDIESISCKGNEYLGKFYQCGDWSLYEKGTYLQKRASF